MMRAEHRETQPDRKRLALLLTGVMLCCVVLKTCLLGSGSPLTDSHGIRWGARSGDTGTPSASDIAWASDGLHATGERLNEAGASNADSTVPAAVEAGQRTGSDTRDGSRDSKAAPSAISEGVAEYSVAMLEIGAVLRPNACDEPLDAILARHQRGSRAAAADTAASGGHQLRAADGPAAADATTGRSSQLSRRGLYAVAAGSASVSLVHAAVAHFLSYPEFDVVILAYDNYNWSDASKHPWAALGQPRVRIIRAVGGFKYVVAKQHLPADLLRSDGYSHLFLWDDDIELQSSFSARNVLLTLQLAPQLKVAAPFVTAGCHLSCWVNEVHAVLPVGHASASGAPSRSATPSSQPALPAKADKQLSSAHFLIETPEMMVPIYAVDAWGCYADLIDPELPESWGIDSVTAGCLCAHVGATLQGPGQAMLLHNTVAHVNKRALSRANIDRARKYEHKIVAALANTTGGRACVEAGGPLRQDGTQAHLARGACLQAAAGGRSRFADAGAPVSK